MRILITNITLATRTGTELYVRDIATALLDRGHIPMVYTLALGPVAEELQASGVTVVADLDALATPPEVIHGHHNIPTMTAVLRFPRMPAIFVCHSVSWIDSPARFPSILRYVAVDFACRDWLVLKHAIPRDRVQVLLNFVDLERFKLRGPLPPRPERALVFSNNASERTYLGAVREACARAGIALDVMGASAGNSCARPGEVLGRYDLVFAKGRCALEALAVGAAVVVCDAAGVGPMVTIGEFDQLRSLNFGSRAFREPVNPAVLAREIARYDPDDAAEVSRRIRATAGRDAAVDNLVHLYQEVHADRMSRGAPDVDFKRRAAAHLHLWGWRLLKWYGPIKYRFVRPGYSFRRQREESLKWRDSAGESARYVDGA